MLIRMSVFCAGCVLCLSFLFSPYPAHADDTAWVIDVTDVAGDSLFGMCEDNDVLYFIGISAEQERRLCALPLDTKEILWTIDLNPDDWFLPVIDEEGYIHISSNVRMEAYTISTAGVIIDTTSISFHEPHMGKDISVEGTIRWNGVQNGYRSEAQAIGPGGIALTTIDNITTALGLHGDEQWQATGNGIGLNELKYSVVNRDGDFYFVTQYPAGSTTTRMFAFETYGQFLGQFYHDNWYFKDILTTPVIGSDGSVYLGIEGNRIIRVGATSSQTNPIGELLDIYQGDSTLWDKPNTNPLMIVQDSLLCWGAEGFIEAFVIPSQGYQEDAFWPCFGHDNRRSFTTSITLYTVSGHMYWEGELTTHLTAWLAGTDFRIIPDSNGAFSVLLPDGQYTFIPDRSDIETKVIVDGASVDDVEVFGSSDSFIWSSELCDPYYMYLTSRDFAIDHDGNVIVAVSLLLFNSSSTPGACFSISPDGTRNWRASVGEGRISTSPVIDEDNVAYYCESEDHQLVMYQFVGRNQDGSIKWSDFYSPDYPKYAAAIGENGTVYAHDPSKGIVGYNGDGEQVWQSAEDIAGEPVIGTDGTIYVYSGSTLWAFNTDGTVKWTWHSPGPLRGISLSNEYIYVTRGNGDIYQISIIGQLVRTYHAEGSLVCSPAVDEDGTLYIGTNNGNFYAFDSGGSVKWQRQLPDAVQTTPIIASNDVIYAAGDSTIYGFTSSGNMRWQYNVPYDAYWPDDNMGHVYLTLGDNGTLYCLSSRLRSLYAFQTSSRGIKTNAPWPCYRANNQRTGRLATNYPIKWKQNVIIANYPYMGQHQLAIDHMGNIIAGLQYYYSGNHSPGALLSLSPDGTLNWSGWGPVYGPPVVTDDNSIIICQSDDTIAATAWYSASIFWYQSTGARRYHPNEKTTIPATIDSDGIVYIATSGAGIRGYDESDSVVWQSETTTSGVSVMDNEGNLYVVSDSTLTVFDTFGSTKWTYNADNTLHEPVLGDGCVYVGCEDYTIKSFWSDGSVKRIYYPGTRPSCPPAIDSDGTLYVGGKNEILYALNDNGTVTWEVELDSPSYTTPVIAADGTIFAATKTTVYAINPSGQIDWKYWFPLEVYNYGSPDRDIYLALDDTGILYCLPSRVKELYAFQTNTSGLKTTAPWPCYRGNNQRTGCLPSDFVVTAEEQEPVEFDLLANYPNPFNPTTTISFTLPERGKVRLAVYSVSGQKVATLVDDMLDAGAHQVVFDGSGLASGLYIYRLEADGKMQTGKMLLMK